LTLVSQKRLQMMFDLTGKCINPTAFKKHKMSSRFK